MGVCMYELKMWTHDTHTPALHPWVSVLLDCLLSREMKTKCTLGFFFIDKKSRDLSLP
jgi:hypothetical protein